MNPFHGVAQEKLEEWLEACREELATGKTLVTWGAGDASGGSMAIRGLTVERRIELILAELSELDPKAYPPAMAARVRRTTPRYVW